MNSNPYYDEIKALVSLDKLDDAIVRLSFFTKHSTSLENDVIMQSARFIDIKKRIIRGLVSFEEIDIIESLEDDRCFIYSKV